MRRGALGINSKFLSGIFGPNSEALWEEYATNNPNTPGARSWREKVRFNDQTTSRGRRDFTSYLHGLYGPELRGAPKSLRDMYRAITGRKHTQRGVLNDFGLAYATSGDAWRYARPEFAKRRGLDYTNPQNLYQYAAQHITPYFDSELTRPGREINNLPWEEGGRRIDGTGLGIFGPVLAAAGFGLGLPALSALGGIAGSAGSPFALTSAVPWTSWVGLDKFKPGIFQRG